MNLRSSKTLTIIGLGAAGALILIAGLALVVLPQRSHAHRLDVATAAAQEQLVAARAAAAHPAPAVKVHASDLFRLSEAMPDSDRMPGIVDTLSSLAAASSVSLVSIRPSTPVSLTGYKALPLVAIVTGKFGAVTAFTRRLRDAVQTPGGRLAVNGRLFDVNQIVMTSADGRTVSATLNLDAFDYVPAPVVPANGPGSSTTTGAAGAT